MRNPILYLTIAVSYIYSVAGFGAVDVGDIAAACYAGFMESIPPTFCYKKGGDFGRIPSTCSSGYFRNGALCFENCPSGMRFSAGLCWTECPSGYRNDPATCYKFPNVIWKKTTIPKSYTNFDSRVGCAQNEYKAGALCYRDCSQIGMANCGIGACSASNESCAATILEMVVNQLMAIAKGIAFVLSFGASSAATPAAQQGVSEGFKKLGKGAVAGAVKSFKALIAKQGMAVFKKQVIKYVTKNVAKFTLESVTTGLITTVCESVSDKLMDKMNKSKDGSDLNLQSFDVTGISGAVQDCKNPKTENDRIKCAGSVLNAINFVDPTGLSGMAAAMMHPVCEGV